MKTASYDFILPFFTSPDKLRPSMSLIHGDDNGYVYATNASMVIKVPAESCMLQYNKIDKFPDCESFISKYDFIAKTRFNVDQAIEILAAHKWTRELNTKTCEECNGTGVIMCDACNHEHECKDCNGEGSRVTGIANLSLLVTTEYYQVVKIQNKVFRADYIHVLTVCAALLKVEEISVLWNENEYDPHIFEVGDAQILIMPRRQDLNDFVYEIKVL
jgi:hypothetical protein